MKKTIIDYITSAPYNTYINLAKRIIKSLSKTNKVDGIASTCTNIILNNYNDIIFQDIVQEIALAVYEHIDCFTVAYDCRTKETRFYTIAGSTIAVKSKTGKEKDVLTYNYLCKIVRDYLDKNTNKSVELVVDNDKEDSEKELSIIDTLSIRNQTRAYQLYEFHAFLDYCKKHCKPALFDEISDFCYLLSNGHKINTIAELMMIKESRAYWLRKKVASLFSEYMPIERKTINFVKVSYVDNNGTEKEYYKRVDVNTCKMTIADKAHNVQVYTIPCYTENKGFSIDGMKAEKNIVNHGGEIVLPMENTRVRTYVINMSKNAYVNPWGCTSFISEKTAGGSYTFKYGDNMSGYRTEYKRLNNYTCLTSAKKEVKRFTPTYIKLDNYVSPAPIYEDREKDKVYRMVCTVNYPWYKD